MLSTGVEPIDPKRIARRHLLAVGGGGLAALALMATTLKLNPALPQELSEPMFWAREAFCASLGVVGILGTARLARPGRPLGLIPVGIALPVIAMWGLAAIILLTAPSSTRVHLIFGRTARVCPFLIAMIGAPPFFAFIWALRGLAPTRLRVTGGTAGFAAGSISALAYSLHCPELAAPFIGIWYLLGITLCATLGAWVGPRLLRW
ncbi:MAG: hypothetical protein JWL65_3996 [Gammaproteobacteria bacterium]|nr:hypothetical protein [Gammaproteobacteria bacterium]